MFVAAENENDYPQEDGQVLSGNVGSTAVAFHRQEHENIAEKPQDEQAQQAVLALGINQGLGRAAAGNHYPGLG